MCPGSADHRARATSPAVRALPLPPRRGSAVATARPNGHAEARRAHARPDGHAEARRAHQRGAGASAALSTEVYGARRWAVSDTYEMIKAVIIEPIRNVYVTGFDASGFAYDEGATSHAGDVAAVVSGPRGWPLDVSGYRSRLRPPALSEGQYSVSRPRCWRMNSNAMAGTMMSSAAVATMVSAHRVGAGAAASLIRRCVPSR
jgi:hypothetical protein